MVEFDPQTIFEISRPSKKLLTLYVLRCLLTGPGFLIAFPPCFFKYETLRYRFDREGISMSWGVLWRREIYVTFARIQDIHISRGLLERWLNLATIHIQTASGSAGAELSVVGLTEYEPVRDFLYSNMRGARLGDEADWRSPETPDSESQADEITALLSAIRDDLRSIRQRLAESRGPAP